MESRNPDAEMFIHCKRVDEGDTLIGESGQVYKVKKEGINSLYAQKVE